MYEYRHPAKRVEVVDLDPYGTAAPFIDGAVQCVADGGKQPEQITYNCLELTFRSDSNHLYRFGRTRRISISRKVVSLLPLFDQIGHHS